jgi:glycosyltransferase involved in cell wall biosynthesis
MKSILFLPSWYPSRLDAFTGDFIQRHALALSLFMPVHVVFIVKDRNKSLAKSIRIEEKTTGNLTETIIYYTSKNYRVGFIERLMSIWKYDSVFKQFFSKLISQNGKPSAVHVHVPYKAGLIALWFKKKYNLNYYVTEHWAGYDKTNTDNFFSRPALFRYVTKKILSNSKNVICVSEDLAFKLSSITPSIKTKVIPNTVNEKLFYFEKNTHQVFKFIHHISAWRGQKNTEGLIRVLSEFHKKRQDWECIMYGPVQPELAELVIALGLVKHIKFTGEISYQKVGEIVRSASAFITFSNYENQPCSILEALCCGVPVIATNVGGIPEIVNSQNGILVEPKNELQLLHAIEMIMEKYNNYNQQAIAEDSKNKFSFHTVGKQLSLLYRS